ncbi:hypothetical protein ADK60_38585 [Streptomyces sp. XY431]|uniref:hypothetical protein n=1 Tax=Streptomyces sp. XY431 TaxID=1415562 RepID=UPI0006ADF78B|nr:hypothetical protein [Streptomyces sp. XY431]KOV10158.1 hypothetical protein ADK60_38585 [Streptomyces sp. XY431]
MRNHITPAALALAMVLAGAPWQTGNWGGGIAAGILTGLTAHGLRWLARKARRASAPAPVNAYDRDRNA